MALVPALVLFGYGQGRVMAPLFGAVLANVRHAQAGAGSGILTTTQQTANAAGVALIGLVYFTVARRGIGHAAMLAALAVLSVLVLCAALSLRWMRRVLNARLPAVIAASRHCRATIYVGDWCRVAMTCRGQATPGTDAYTSEQPPWFIGRNASAAGTVRFRL